MRLVIVVFVSIFGVLGCSVQLAAINDMLFFCSFWILGIYLVFARIYNFTLTMMLTLF